MMPISEICLDANVFIAALMPSESGHESALRAVQAIDAARIALFEPAIVLFEVGAALHRKRFQRSITEQEAEGALDIFFQLPLLLQWQSGILKKAADLAESLALKKMYDCTYLAVAMTREIPLLTFDGHLLKKGRRLYKRIYPAHDASIFSRMK